MDFKYSQTETGIKIDKYIGDAKAVTIPEGVTTIGNGAFSYCKNLTEIKIPASVRRIYKETFAYCTNLECVTINPSTEIDDGAFIGCEKLKEIRGLTEEQINKNPHLAKVLYISRNTNYLVAGEDKIKYLKKISGIKIRKYIGDRNSVTSIVIPDMIDGLPVTEIGDYAFSGYSNLLTIKIPDTLKSLGAFAFYDCYRLTKIELPDSVTKIAAGVFSHCRTLTEIKIPVSIAKIYNGTFKGCEKLAQIKIPEGVTEIGNGAFRDCRNLKSIRLPRSVKKIGSSAFRSCKNLLTVELPASAEIGKKAFANCHESLKINRY